MARASKSKAAAPAANDPDAPPKKRAKKSAPASTKKKGRRAAAEEEEPDVEIEDGEEDSELVCGGNDEGDDEPAEEGNDEGNDEPAEEETPEMAAERAAEKERRLKRIQRSTNERARMKGYRSQATKAGIGKNNTLMNVASVEDVRRAAKFVPVNLQQPPFSIEEFKRRLELSITPLPDSAAAALRPHFEKVLRGLVEAAVGRLIRQGSQTLKASHLDPDIMAIEKFGDFSFVFPDGLRCFAQYSDKTGQLTGKSGEPALIPASTADVEATRHDKTTKKKLQELVKEAQGKVKKAKEEREARIAAKNAAAAQAAA